MFNLESLSQEAYFALGKIDAILSLICFIALIYLIYVNMPHLSKFFRSINKRTWFILLIILLFSMILRTAIVVPKNLIYVDEHMYMHRADQMFSENQGLPYDDIDIVWYSKSNGWPFFQSIFFKLFGPSNLLPIYISLLLGSLTSIMLFFILKILTNNIRISIISSLIYTLFPLNIFWSASADNTVPSVFFISLSILLILLYYKENKDSLLWLSIISLAFMTHFRIENYAIAIVFFLIYLYKKRNIIFSAILKFIKTLLPIAVYAVLVIPDILFTLAFSSTSCSNIEPQKLASFITSFSSNYLHMILLVLIIILTFIGILYLSRKNKKQALMIFSLYFSAASIIIFFWLNSLFNYFPFSLEYYNLYNRFLLTGVFATIVFIGCGLDYIRVLRKSNYSLLILLPIIALILILALTLLSDVDKMNNNALILQSQVPKFISDNLSDESIIVSSCPEIFLGDKKIIDYDSYLSLSESSTLSETFLLRDMCYYQRIHSNIIESINSSTSLKIYHIFEREGFIFEIFRVG